MHDTPQLSNTDFSRMYQNQHGYVLAYTQRWQIPTRDAPDLAQTVFLRAWANRSAYRDDGRGPRPWLTTIASRLIYDYNRRAVNQRTIWGLDPEDLNMNVEPGHADLVAERIDTAQLCGFLRHFIKQLPPRHRQVLYLRFYQDKNLAQTAAALGCTTAAVKQLQQRAWARLRRDLVHIDQ